MIIRLRRSHNRTNIKDGQYIIRITLANRADMVTTVDDHMYSSDSMVRLFDDLHMLVNIMMLDKGVLFNGDKLLNYDLRNR